MGYDDATVISRSVSSSFDNMQDTGTGDAMGTINKDFPSPLPHPEATTPPHSFSLVESKQVVPKGLDRSLLNRAKDIIDSFNNCDVMESTIDLESLRGTVLQLWESATNGTQFHQEILATLESAILSVESPNESQLSVFKEAVMDLENDILTQAHVDIIRERFVAEGFSPLALLSEAEDDSD